jgi:hypothetical protein
MTANVNGTIPGLTEVELAQAEALCRAATPGPWEWAEERFNRRAGGDRAEWAYLLLGPAAGCMAGCWVRSAGCGRGWPSWRPRGTPRRL